MSQAEKQLYVEKSELANLDAKKKIDQNHFTKHIENSGSSSPDECASPIKPEDLILPKITVIHRQSFGESIAQTSKFSLIVFEKHT